LTRDLELLALLPDLAEQPGILDRQHRLGGEGLQQFNCARGKFARLLPPDHERPDDAISADERHDETRSKSSAHCDLSHSAWRLVANICDFQWLSVLARLGDAIGSPGCGAWVAWRGASEPPAGWPRIAPTNSSLKPYVARTRNVWSSSSKT